MREVVIVSAKRSAIGRFGGSLKDMSAADLGEKVVSAALKQVSIDPTLVDEVIMGNVLSAGLGQNISRQIALKAGLRQETTAFTVNQVCGSGLKAIILGAQSILLGDNDIVVAGGVENMSQAPYVLPDYRFGGKLGDGAIIDTLMKDGLTDAFSNDAMGITAENIAEQFDISRKEQDEFAASSQKKAEEAIKQGKFKEEIVSIEIPSKRGESINFDTDEFPRFATDEEKLSKLRPSFKVDGTVTAGNASGINDGAAAVVLMSKEKANSLGLEILGTIASYATSGVDPSIMGIGPVPATKKALEKANLSLADLDIVEANEAFASQSLCVAKELGLNPEIVNVNGGAISLGHPIGASGARILVTLLHEMKKRDSKTGLATLCIGGGQGISLVISR